MGEQARRLVKRLARRAPAVYGWLRRLDRHGKRVARRWLDGSHRLDAKIRFATPAVVATLPGVERPVVSKLIVSGGRAVNLWWRLPARHAENVVDVAMSLRSGDLAVPVSVDVKRVDRELAIRAAGSLPPADPTEANLHRRWLPVCEVAYADGRSKRFALRGIPTCASGAQVSHDRYGRMLIVRDRVEPTASLARLDARWSAVEVAVRVTGLRTEGAVLELRTGQPQRTVASVALPLRDGHGLASLPLDGLPIAARRETAVVVCVRAGRQRLPVRHPGPAEVATSDTAHVWTGTGTAVRIRSSYDAAGRLRLMCRPYSDPVRAAP
jgi:hypothetical protein